MHKAILNLTLWVVQHINIIIQDKKIELCLYYFKIRSIEIWSFQTYFISAPILEQYRRIPALAGTGQLRAAVEATAQSNQAYVAAGSLLWLFDDIDGQWRFVLQYAIIANAWASEVLPPLQLQGLQRLPYSVLHHSTAAGVVVIAIWADHPTQEHRPKIMRPYRCILHACNTNRRFWHIDHFHVYNTIHNNYSNKSTVVCDIT